MVMPLPHAPLRFSKMHGAGNDFVVLDLRNSETPSPALCRALSDRHFGVGCDLVLGVGRPRSASAVASYSIWTSDGSPSPQCGNGARCIAAWALREGIANSTRFKIDSPVGTHSVEVLDSQRITVALGQPRFCPREIPLAGFETEQLLYDAAFPDGFSLRFAAVSMGNPHAVIEMSDVDNAPLHTIGPILQNSEIFPQSVNVGVAQLVASDHIKLRVYEYGAGETLACGSGACAAAAVLMRQGRLGRSATVSLRGGDLRIAWADNESPILMTGPAEFVFDGLFWSHQPDALCLTCAAPTPFDGAPGTSGRTS